MGVKVYKFGQGPRGGTIWGFHCPGCGYGHPFEVPQWTWDGSEERPTFFPSLLVHGDPPNTPRCHSVVVNGFIQFLPDSTHKLAGQTVEIPDFDAPFDA